MNEGVALVAEVEEWRIDKRIETKYLDEKYIDIDAAIDAAVNVNAWGMSDVILQVDTIAKQITAFI